MAELLALLVALLGLGPGAAVERTIPPRALAAKGPVRSVVWLGPERIFVDAKDTEAMIWTPSGTVLRRFSGTSWADVVHPLPDGGAVALRGHRVTFFTAEGSRAPSAGNPIRAWSLSLAAGGGYAALGSYTAEKGIRLYSLADLRAGAAPTRVLQGPTYGGDFEAIALDDAGGRVVASFRSWGFMAWGPGHAAPRWEKLGMDHAVEALWVSPDGRTLVVLQRHRNRLLRLDPDTGAVLAELKVPAAGGRLLAVGPASRRLFTTARPRALLPIALPALRPRRALKLPFTPDALAIAPDGRQAVVAQGRAYLRLDLRTGELREPGPGHAGPVRRLAWSPDARLLASAGADATVRVWDAQSGAQLARLGPFLHPARDLVFEPGGALLTAGGDGTLRRFRPKDWRETRRLGYVRACVFRNFCAGTVGRVWSGAGAVLSQSGARLRLHRPRTLALRSSWVLPEGVRSIALAPAGTPFVLATADRIEAVDAATGRRIWMRSTASATLAISPDGAFLALRPEARVIRVLELRAGQPSQEIRSALPLSARMAWLRPDLLLAVRRDGGFTVWRVSDGAKLWETAPTRERPSALVVAPGGARLATGHADGSLRIWRLPP